jgi:hypothetical protein
VLRAVLKQDGGGAEPKDVRRENFFPLEFFGLPVDIKDAVHLRATPKYFARAEKYKGNPRGACPTSGMMVAHSQSGTSFCMADPYHFKRLITIFSIFGSC